MVLRATKLMHPARFRAETGWKVDPTADRTARAADDRTVGRSTHRTDRPVTIGIDRTPERMHGDTGEAELRCLYSSVS